MGTYNRIYILVGILILTSFVEGWNERVKCKYLNSIVGNPRLASLKAFVLRQNWTQYLLINQAEQELLSNHQRSIPFEQKQFSKQLFNDPINCKNLYKYNETCCNQHDFHNYSHILLSIYEKYIFNTKYPIFHTLSNISELIVKNNCYAKSTKPPSMLNFTYMADYIGYSPQIRQAIDKHDSQMQKLMIIQKEFIRSSVCLMCIGVKQFPNFIDPDLETTTDSSASNKHYNHQIINKSYFISIVKSIYNIYRSLQDLHVEIRDHIETIASNIAQKTRNSKQQCNEAYRMGNNLEQLDRQKICEGLQCAKIAVRYFGQAGAPQNMRFIKSRGSGIGMAMGMRDYRLSENIGFSGNATDYGMYYGTRFVAQVVVYEKMEYGDLWKLII